MRIGVPKETKTLEGRVALVPAACGDLVKAGHEVYVESTAGIKSGFSDSDFIAVGVRIAKDAAELYEKGELIVKVKEPIAGDLALLRKEHLLFCYLHLAPEPALTKRLLEIGLCGIAFESVEEADGSLPLLAPMSVIAGRIAVQWGTTLLHQPNGGKGKLLGGLPSADRGKVVVLGAGAAGGNSASLAAAMGANVVVFGLGGIGLNVVQGAKMVGADKIIGVDLNPAREKMARDFGMTHFINPKDTPNVVDAIVQLTDGGADYSFECIGNTQVMRQALECTHKGWGRSIIIGVAEAGAEISTRPFQLVTGRKWEGSAFGGARGRTDVPKIVDWYMDGKLNIDDLITHKLKLEDINEGFALMKRGESIRSVVEF